MILSISIWGGLVLYWCIYQSSAQQFFLIMEQGSSLYHVYRSCLAVFITVFFSLYEDSIHSQFCFLKLELARVVDQEPQQVKIFISCLWPS